MENIQMYEQYKRNAKKRQEYDVVAYYDNILKKLRDANNRLNKQK